MSQINAKIICMPIDTTVEVIIVNQDFRWKKRKLKADCPSGSYLEGVVVHRLDVFFDEFERGEKDGVDNA